MKCVHVTSTSLLQCRGRCSFLVGGMVADRHRHNLLRPETVETLFVLFHITEVPKYHEFGTSLRHLGSIERLILEVTSLWMMLPCFLHSPHRRDTEISLFTVH
ncbi:mannosyl-oligosaccharide 1,2-alpha-mannosidase [Salvia divinorum]|uniref:Mannosyl-oligosaccharide 1,2-alpha-mannosidase n=1 Tax=Salvia divinorum TaxID=28513 RepID=A0ABD1HVG6_SALDI